MIKVSELQKKFVYLAGPYSIGNKLENACSMNWAAVQLMRAGVIVFNPLLSHFYGPVAKEFTHDWWCEFDLHWVGKCDAMVVLPGESRGAEREAEYAKEHGIPVYQWDDIDWEESE